MCLCLRSGSQLTRNPLIQGLCSFFTASVCSFPFYVAKYESLTDFWHFLYLARIFRQAGISCMSYCVV